MRISGESVMEKVALEVTIFIYFLLGGMAYCDVIRGTLAAAFSMGEDGGLKLREEEGGGGGVFFLILAGFMQLLARQSFCPNYAIFHSFIEG